MSLEREELITSEGNLSLLDRVGGRIDLTLSDEDGAIDISGWSLWFEVGDISVELLTDTGIKYFVVTPAHLTEIQANNWNKFAIINKTPTPDETLWEGYIFIRSVG